MFYALRLDVSSTGWDLFKVALLAWAAANCDSYFIVRETLPENDHTHAILGSSKNIGALRKSLQRAFPGSSGNKHYSLKAADDEHDNYLNYLCKGNKKGEDPVVVAYQGLEYGNSEFISSHHDAYWVNNAQLQKNKGKRSELAGANVVEKVEAIAKAAGVRAYDREAVAKIYIKLYSEARKGISSFHCRSVVNTVCTLLEGGESSVDCLAADIANKY